MWRYQTAFGNCCRPYHHAAERSHSFAFRRWVLTFWRGREVIARDRWIHDPVRAALLCIHGGEGAWDDPAPPYYGGLQMDDSFARTYGPWQYATKGTPDHWTPLEQLTAGARAVRVRGYGPWPLTRIPCGV